MKHNRAGAPDDGGLVRLPRRLKWLRGTIRNTETRRNPAETTRNASAIEMFTNPSGGRRREGSESREEEREIERHMCQNLGGETGVNNDERLFSCRRIEDSDAIKPAETLIRLNALPKTSECLM